MSTSFKAPTLKRRITVSLYEMLVLLGVWAVGHLLPYLMIGVLFFSKSNLSEPEPWLAGLVFFHLYALFGIYFVWYWTKTGQTLAMQTWHVKLVDTSGQLLTRSHAIKRYAYASLWLVPTVFIYALLVSSIGKVKMLGWPSIELMFFMALLFWPLTCLLDRRNPNGKQSLVDKITKTQLIQLPKH